MPPLIKRLVLLGALGTIGFVAFWTLGVFQPIHVALRPAPTLIVLGAAQYNGKPSPLFKRRLDHALELYRQGGVKHIVVSGGIGTGDHFSEGGVGKSYLESRGVPARVVLAECSSRTTVQNLENSRALLSSPDAPITLVTDDVHAPRALSIAQNLGLHADVSPAPLIIRTEQGREYRNRERVLLVVQKIFGNDAMR